MLKLNSARFQPNFHTLMFSWTHSRPRWSRPAQQLCGLNARLGFEDGNDCNPFRLFLRFRKRSSSLPAHASDRRQNLHFATRQYYRQRRHSPGRNFIRCINVRRPDLLHRPSPVRSQIAERHLHPLWRGPPPVLWPTKPSMALSLRAISFGCSVSREHRYNFSSTRFALALS
jgi:hypothetical protein